METISFGKRAFTIVMDDYQALKEIRNDEKLKHLPVIVLTAQAMKGDMEKCLESGANDYCSKPVNMKLLLDKTSALLKQFGS